MKNSQPSEPDSDFYHKLKWLMFFRVLFTTLLLGSTIVLQFGEKFFPLSDPLLVLYELIAGLFLLSFIYSVLLPRIKRVVLFAYVQVSIDTLMVTLIIFLTGSFTSLFSFLYLVVIIYASMLLFRKGSMIMAALCSIQYGIMVDMEFYGVITPFGIEDNLTTLNIAWSYVLYKIIIIMVACFAVAFLSGFLAEQARKTQKELRAMEAHVKRVEKMAAVGEMAAGLAHEIKNPLASLRGSIQILIEDVVCDPGNEKLMNIILREA
ncbi:histidine kinase dimerization/phospho-acceptor domain-containing protein, partial [Desulfobacterales bacterium HSG17]|nr:histidine kinase dimerization/phospho-acceptor domain-containing protein [Desulfobacterales bacterium HSG17]